MNTSENQPSMLNHEDLEKQLIYEVASQALADKNYQKAIENFEQIPPDYQDTVDKLLEARYELAKQHLGDNNCEQALPIFERIQAEKPDTSEIAAYIKEAKCCKRLSGLTWIKTKLGLSWVQLCAGAGILAGLLIVLLLIMLIIFWPDREPPPPPTPTDTVAAATKTSTPQPESASGQGDTPDEEPESPEEDTSTSEKSADTSGTGGESSEQDTSEAESNTEEDTKPSPPPAAPTNLQISDVSASSLTLTWDNSPGTQTKVIIQLDGATIKELPADAQSYTVANLECGSAFTLVILTANETAQSEPAQVAAETAACTPPPILTPKPVTNPQVANKTKTSVTLNWANPTNNYTKILLQGGGTSVELPAGTQNHTLSDLKCETSYNFTLFAINQAGQSEPVSISAKTADCSEEAPPPSPSLTGKIAVPVFNTTLNTYDLYLASAPDWEPELFQNAASQPVFSLQGDQIMFRSWGGGQNISPYAEKLVTRSLTSATDQPVTTHSEDARPDWDKFNRPVVLHTCPNWDCQIYLLGLWGEPGDAGRRMHMTDGKNPTWLPDGRIVYSSAHPNGIGMYVINQDKSGMRKIWDNNTLVAPNGSPVSNDVVFSLNDDLYLLTVTNGTSQPKPLLQTSEYRERLPVWSPDGSMIAYVKDQGDEKWSVYVINADGSGETKLFDLPGSIDGRPSNAQVFFGWEEEQLSWAP